MAVELPVDQGGAPAEPAWPSYPDGRPQGPGYNEVNTEEEYQEWLEEHGYAQSMSCNLVINYHADGYNGENAVNPPSKVVRSYSGKKQDVTLSITVASGESMSNDGYIFVGWHKHVSQGDVPSLVTHNPGDRISYTWLEGYNGNHVIDLYAVWTDQNVISYHPDSNTIEAASQYQVKQEGQTATLKGVTFTRTGYTQTGWSTTEGGSKNYNLGGSYSGSAALNLYPVWTADTYTISFDANEGTGTMQAQTITFGSEFTLSDCSFTREGYSFSSWNEDADGKGVRWPSGTYTVTRAEDITLYAIWKGKEYTVSYNSNSTRVSEELTGDMITFTTDYEQPLDELKVDIEPIQDLRGYSKPWCAGGGKNKLPKTGKENGEYVGVTITVNDDGSITCDGTATDNLVIGFPTNPVTIDLPNGEYVLSGGISNEVYMTLFDGTDNTGTRYDNKTSPKTFTLTSGHAYSPRLVIKNGSTLNSVIIYPMLRLSSESDDAYEPYENICQIEGISDLTIHQTGENLSKIAIAPGRVSNGITYTEKSDHTGHAKGTATAESLSDLVIASARDSDVIYPLPAGTYTITNVSGPRLWLQTYNASLTERINMNNGITLSSNQYWTQTFTEPVVVYGRFDISSGTTVDADGHMMVTKGTARSTSYAPWKKNTYELSFTNSAGAVYGATLYPDRGYFIVNRVLYETTWGQMTDSVDYLPFERRRATFTLADDKSKRSLAICNVAPYKTESDEYHNQFEIHDTSRYFYATLLKGTSDDTVIQLCYYLAEPIVYRLSPIEIQTLVGQNNLWCIEGTITARYNLDKVEGSMPPSIAVFGDSFLTRRNQFTSFGRTFIGWNTAPDGSGENWLPSGVTMDTFKRTESSIWDLPENVILYAQWDPYSYPYGRCFFNGKDTKDFGIFVETPPSYFYAERPFNHKPVNGRNGDVLLDPGRYENVKKVYKVSCYDPNKSFYESAVSLSSWLHSAESDYVRLEDTYEPGCYRMAVYEEMNEIENILAVAGKCEITFNCMPQRFLISGDEQVTIGASGSTVYNPTVFDAKPLIQVEGIGNVTVNGRTVEILANTNEIIIDCDKQNAFDLGGADMNYFINCDEFPILKPGFNTVSFDSTITSVKITPRWWML